MPAAASPRQGCDLMGLPDDSASASGPTIDRRFAPVGAEPSGSPRPAPELTARLRSALAELDALGPDGPVSGADVARAEERGQPSAGQLLSLLGDGRADERRLVWGRVAQARTEMKRLEQSPVPAGSGVLDSVAERIERLREELEDLEAKAKRKLAAAGAFRRVVAARRALAEAIDATGFSSYEEVMAARSSDSDVDRAEQRQVIAVELAAAEAAWERLEAGERQPFPAGEAGDVLRSQVYRALGTVVADEEAEAALGRRAALDERGRAAMTLLRAALVELGLPDGGDPRRVAESWLAATSTGPRAVADPDSTARD